MTELFFDIFQLGISRCPNPPAKVVISSLPPHHVCRSSCCPLFLIILKLFIIIIFISFIHDQAVLDAIAARFAKLSLFEQKVEMVVFVLWVKEWIAEKPTVPFKQ